MIRPLLSLDRLSFLEPEGKVGYRRVRGGAEQESIASQTVREVFCPHVPSRTAFHGSAWLCVTIDTAMRPAICFRHGGAGRFIAARGNSPYRRKRKFLSTDARDYLPDLDAIRNLIFWYLSDFGSGPQISRKEAEKLLDDGLTTVGKKGKTIFISYAREGEKKAVEVYDALIDRGHIPWMDKKALVAGQDWKLKIRKAIEPSQYFIALMSEQSVTKRGFVQKELRFALNVLGEIPPGQIYFIPVRLEDCDVPDAIRSSHWVDLRRIDDYEQLFRAVEYE